MEGLLRGGGLEHSAPARSRAPARRIPGAWRSPAPHTGAGLSRLRSPPPAAWRGCPSPPHTTPSLLAASAGTPTRAPPPAGPDDSFATRGHAPSWSVLAMIGNERVTWVSRQRPDSEPTKQSNRDVMFITQRFPEKIIWLELCLIQSCRSPPRLWSSTRRWCIQGVVPQKNMSSP